MIKDRIHLKISNTDSTLEVIIIQQRKIHLYFKMPRRNINANLKLKFKKKRRQSTGIQQAREVQVSEEKLGVAHDKYQKVVELLEPSKEPLGLMKSKPFNPAY